MADSDKKENDNLPNAEEEKDDNKDDSKEDQKADPSHPERIPKEDPGDGKPTETPQSIDFKWNKAFKKKKDCDTLHMLFLLCKALELVRLRTIERNKYFKSIGRTDRYINQLDSPRIVSNLLDWHNKDKEKNKFDGALLDSAEKLYMINNMISDIGGVKKGPATKIFTKLKKDVIIETTQWTELPQPTLKVENWGYIKLYKGEVMLDECTVDQMITLLTYVNPAPTPEEEKDADPNDIYKNFPQGVLELMARKNLQRKGPCALEQEDDWIKKVVDWWKKEQMDGKKFMGTKSKVICQEMMDYFIDPSVLNEKKKPMNTKLRGGCNQIVREMKKVYVNGILEAAAKQQEEK